MSRQVFPHAPSPTITSFFLMAAIYKTENTVTVTDTSKNEAFSHRGGRWKKEKEREREKAMKKDESSPFYRPTLFPFLGCVLCVRWKTESGWGFSTDVEKPREDNHSHGRCSTLCGTSHGVPYKTILNVSLLQACGHVIYSSLRSCPTPLYCTHFSFCL